MRRRKFLISARALVAIFILFIAVTPVILFSLSSNVDKAIANVVSPWHNSIAEIASMTISSRFNHVDFALSDFATQVQSLTSPGAPAENLLDDCQDAYELLLPTCAKNASSNATSVNATGSKNFFPNGEDIEKSQCPLLCNLLLPLANATLRQILFYTDNEDRINSNNSAVKIALWGLAPKDESGLRDDSNASFVEVATLCLFALRNGITVTERNASLSLLRLSVNVTKRIFLFTDANSTDTYEPGGGVWIPLRNAVPPRETNDECSWSAWEEASWQYVSSLEYVNVMQRSSTSQRFAFAVLSFNSSTGIGQSNNCGRTLMGHWSGESVLAASMSPESQLVILDPQWKAQTKLKSDVVISLAHCCSDEANPFAETLLDLTGNSNSCGTEIPQIIVDTDVLQSSIHKYAVEQSELSQFIQVDTIIVSVSSVSLGSGSGKELFSLLLITGSRTAIPEVTQSEITSVIVGVSFTACAVVTVLFLLHYVFHPLKVVGSLLRACADINLVNLERISPSNIAEIFDIQTNVDIVVQRMKQYGKYMPDKSQLSAILSRQSELKGFDETGVMDGTFVGGGAGAIPQSVTVDVEYRSRKRPTLQRTIEDLNKRCTFLLKYTASDNVYEDIMEQVRTRLHERIGETLEMRCKPHVEETAARIDVESCAVLFNTHDVLEAIEQSNDGQLHLMVLKTARKNFAPYLLIVVSLLDVAAVVNVARTWIGDSEEDVHEIALAIGFLLITKLVCNLSACIALHRQFLKKFYYFALWVQDASLEVSASIVWGSFSVCNMQLLFSHTRFTKKLRFNAPYQEKFGHQIIHYAAAGYVFGDVIPMISVSYVVMTNPRVMGIPATLALTSTGLSIALYLSQSFIQRRSRKGAPEALRQEAKEAAAAAEEDDQETNAVAALNVGREAAPKAGAEKTESVGYLGLARRNATVLLVALHDTESHFEGMNTVKIQLLLSNYFAKVFAQANHFHGLVLRLSGTEVTIGFNCHHYVPNHLFAAYQCFNAIEDDLKVNLVQWGDDDQSQPIFCGALVSGAGCTVGYAGTQEARGFQHIGQTAVTLDHLRRMAMFYRARLLVDAAIGTKLDTAFQDSPAGNSNRKVFNSSLHQLPLSGDRLVIALRELDVVASTAESDSASQLRVVEVLRNISSEQLNASRVSFSPGTSFSANTLLLKDYIAKYPQDYPLKAAQQWVGKAQPPRHTSPLGIDLHPFELESADVSELQSSQSGRIKDREDAPHPLLRTLFQKTSYSVYFTDI